LKWIFVLGDENLNEIILKSNQGISDGELRQALEQSLRDKMDGLKLKKVLILPPDFTRMHSGGGKITSMYYELLKDRCRVEIMPALGTHDPVSDEEIEAFFPDIPKELFLEHHWRTDVVRIGSVPADYVEEVSGGLSKEPIDVEINRRLLDESYDLIISVGQVVPHEIAGMANYSKNIFVGCGGSSMISQSHMLGAFYGMEKIMGRDATPVRKVLDYAERLIEKIPLLYVLTVTTLTEGQVHINGLFIGRERRIFEEAVKLSQEKNITYVDQPLKKVVVFLDEREFKSTWLGNKSVYRTRMAIADGGELIVLAPGVKKFGEDGINDRIIRKYGYVGRKKVLELCKENRDLQENLSVAAHLIHGSPDGRFSVTYAVKQLTKEEVEGVHFGYLPFEEAIRQYPADRLKDGFNTLENGEVIYFIRNPALGLWSTKDRFL
jgi:nickel-dependent lactate racemase